MNNIQFLQRHQALCNKLSNMVKKKNADYTGDDVDPFLGFRGIEYYKVATLEVGLFGKMLDKIGRIAGFLRTGKLKVKTESVNDTLLDLADYCLILAVYLEGTHENN